MKSKRRLILACAVILSIIASVPVLGDDHVIVERSRSYMGTQWPAMTTEIWSGEASVWMKTGRFVRIVRFDLQRVWILSP